MKKILLVTSGIALLFVGLIVGIVIMVGVYHNSHVVLDGPSMEPTIHNGQSLTVTKFASGVSPKRGNIVEYSSSNKLVKKYSTSGKLIHRIIALPGERITISNNKVLVFNQQNPNGFNPDTYLAPNIVTAGNVDTTLAPDTFFVMGDNRPNALDSRAIGPTTLSDIIGKVTY